LIYSKKKLGNNSTKVAGVINFVISKKLSIAYLRDARTILIYSKHQYQLCQYYDVYFFNKKGPNGIKAAMKAMAVCLKFQSYSILHLSIQIIYNTNNTPCAQPKYLTGSGLPNRCFMGTATNNKRRKETPSIMAT
jgi:hypothetical protein